jgi:hypothetical protein
MQIVVRENSMVAILDYKTINNVKANDIIKSEDFGKTWQKVFSIDGYPNWTILEIVDVNTIYLGCNKLLFESNDFGKKWNLIKEFDDPIKSIRKSPWGNIYVGTYGGLYAENLDVWNYITVPYNSPIVNQISFSSKGEMFILGFELYVSIDRGKSFQQVRFPLGILQTVARNFLLDEENGKIFLGTQERGLFVTYYSYSSVSIPAYSLLYNNYPNPFNNQTSIEFYLKESCDVKLEIYNTLGERVYELVYNNTDPGFYKLNWNAKNFSSGIYFYRLQTQSFSETKKMILLK